MNWIDRWLQKRFPFFVIKGKVGSPYMVRYRLFVRPTWGLYLHHILRSDEDAELHDHPWGFTSLVLWAGYREVLPGGERVVRPMSLVRHAATDRHRLILKEPAWTLVKKTPRLREWGFWTADGWMKWTDFLDRKYGVGNW